MNQNSFFKTQKILKSLLIVSIASISTLIATNTSAKPTSERSNSQEILLAQNRCQLNSFEQEVIDLTNQERRRSGLRSLSFNCQLTVAAQNHTLDMERNRMLSHTGSDGSSMVDRVRRTGYRPGYLGENVAVGQRTPQEVVDSWMRSSGHRRNILNPNYEEIGVGYDNRYWTQVFGTQR